MWQLVSEEQKFLRSHEFISNGKFSYYAIKKSKIHMMENWTTTAFFLQSGNS